MANRRPGQVAAPVKQKLRKRHGPKRKMFHKFDSTFRLQASQASILTKYYDYESFVLACGARGVRTFIQDLWQEFYKLNTEEQKEFFKNLKTHEAEVAQRAAIKTKKAGKTLTKGAK